MLHFTVGLCIAAALGAEVVWIGSLGITSLVRLVCLLLATHWASGSLPCIATTIIIISYFLYSSNSR